MNVETSPQRQSTVPEIVRIVLTQAVKRRAEGDISPQRFDLQIERLSTEELQPRGLSLLVRELADGHTRFLIKGKNGTVCDMIECNGTCVSL